MGSQGAAFAGVRAQAARSGGSQGAQGAARMLSALSRLCAQVHRSSKQQACNGSCDCTTSSQGRHVCVRTGRWQQQADAGSNRQPRAAASKKQREVSNASWHHKQLS